ncbi:MAG: NAD-dependent epimerase/dehydratase family protein [Acidimicrobiaceae bacterium]|nr:NAD-dependent epimerase/dehydratase family protein [Acidimicrobiaceae bacterium]MYG97874.1 NAD-dependent epimerase/dehydratase family protein [Acidimicrobiaceae bacterium]MYL03567.1 NAD-dependent epimerase/dehydratase family protein [Acidimicrobiaceae bacterium]
MAEHFLVTGADGCIGAWTVRLLLDEGAEVTTFDLGENDNRHRLVSDGAPRNFRRITGNIIDRAAVVDAMAGVDRVIHLAALQVPFCQADPSSGAAVNVQGTVNVFEAAVEHGISPVAYASSAAIFGPVHLYPDPVLGPDALPKPATLYGAYKVANEQTAAVFAADHGLASVGLRPFTVYGAGRDQGVTSQPTAAIYSAVRGEPYQVGYGGVTDFHYAPDVARAFIAASRVELHSPAAPAVNLRGHVTSIDDFVDRVRRITGFDDLSVSGEPLPFAHALSTEGLAELLGDTEPTPLDDAIAETARLVAASP